MVCVRARCNGPLPEPCCVLQIPGESHYLWWTHTRREWCVASVCLGPLSLSPSVSVPVSWRLTIYPSLFLLVIFMLWPWSEVVLIQTPLTDTAINSQSSTEREWRSQLDEAVNMQSTCHKNNLRLSCLSHTHTRSHMQITHAIHLLASFGFKVAHDDNASHK